MKKIDEILPPESEIISGSPDARSGCIYKSADGAPWIYRVVLDSGLNVEEKNILFLADTHFAAINARDISENNPLVLTSYEKRGPVFGGDRVVKNATEVMKYSPQFDKTVLLGDSMDFLSYGGLQALERYIYGACPDALVLVGNHDDTRIAGHRASDETPRSSREEILASVIKNDIFYHSESLGKAILLIGMNNCHRRYTEQQRALLEADICRAREEGRKVIIAQHEMINTGREEDSRLPVLHLNSSWCYNSAYNFCNGADKIGTAADNETTSAVYNLISSSADVILAVFAGHWHNAAYCEINATYNKDGKTVNTTIPQYVVPSAAYGDGFMAVVTVK